MELGEQRTRFVCKRKRFLLFSFFSSLFFYEMWIRVQQCGCKHGNFTLCKLVELRTALAYNYYYPRLFFPDLQQKSALLCLLSVFSSTTFTKKIFFYFSTSLMSVRVFVSIFETISNFLCSLLLNWMEKEALNYCGGGIENAGLLRKSLCQLQNCWGVCSSPHIHSVCVCVLGVSWRVCRTWRFKWAKIIWLFSRMVYNIGNFWYSHAI